MGWTIGASPSKKIENLCLEALAFFPALRDRGMYFHFSLLMNSLARHQVEDPLGWEISLWQPKILTPCVYCRYLRFCIYAQTLHASIFEYKATDFLGLGGYQPPNPKKSEFFTPA
jgi:hypothetical protein